MSTRKKVLEQVLSGRSDKAIRFAELRSLLRRIGFEERVRGGHHLFTRTGVPELINLQRTAGKAKPYQVKQVRNVLLRMVDRELL